jgi:addiction module RelE/StbE family toxin
MAVRLEWSNRALADLDRLDAFLHDKTRQAAADAIDTILAAVNHLLAFPLSGRSLSEDEDDVDRELIVPFSNSGYVVLYVFDGESVEIHRVRHQREAGY